MATTRRHNAKQRQAERTQARKHKQTIVLLVAVAVVLFTAAGMLLLTQQAETVTHNPRFEKEAILGNPNAPVTIIEYASYGCPSCQAWHEAGIIETIIETFPDQVRFIYRNFPAIRPTYDRLTAELAQCALDQGDQQFWDYHHLLYTYGSPTDSRSSLIQLGAGANLDLDALTGCMDAGTHQDTVQYYYQLAVNMGLNSAPNFYVNGKPLFSLSPDAMMEMVRSELGL